MFLFVDESCLNNDYIVLGCLSLTEKDFINLENKVLHKRIEKSLWSEMKWQKCSNQYLQKYLDIVKMYFNEKSVTFHSLAFKSPSREVISKHFNDDKESVIHKYKYQLIRTVIWKCLNYKYKNQFYIIIDSGDERNSKEVKLMKEYLPKDTTISPRANIRYCDIGNSSILGSFYVNDICLGSVCNFYTNKYKKSKWAVSINQELEKINNRRSIIYSASKLPQYNDFRLHHLLTKTRE